MIDTPNFYSVSDKFQSERSHKQVELHCLHQLPKGLFDTRQHICLIKASNFFQLKLGLCIQLCSP